MWCPIVPNTFFVARRGEHVWITGNTPIQGTSSDIVINSMNRLSEYAHETKQERFQPRKEIHDDLTFILPNATLEDDLFFILKEMCLSPHKDFTFVNVPIQVEASVGDDWYNMEKLVTYQSTDFSEFKNIKKEEAK